MGTGQKFFNDFSELVRISIYAKSLKSLANLAETVQTDPGSRPLGPSNVARGFPGPAPKALLTELKSTGMSARQMAAELTARGIPTPNGAKWHGQTVRRMINRVGC